MKHLGKLDGDDHGCTCDSRTYVARLIAQAQFVEIDEQTSVVSQWISLVDFHGVLVDFDTQAGASGHVDVAIANDEGTLEIAEFVSNLKDSYTVLGGGDSVAVIPGDTLAKFDFVSMGGGATLEYLAD